MPRIVPAISESEAVLDAVEACDYLGGISRQALHNYARIGIRGRKLVTRKIGGRIWFLPSDLKAFVSPESQATAVPEKKERKPAGKMSAETTAELRRMGFKI